MGNQLQTQLIDRAIRKSERIIGENDTKVAMSYKENHPVRRSFVKSELSSTKSASIAVTPPVAPVSVTMSAIGCKLAVRKRGVWKRRYLELQCPKNEIIYYEYNKSLKNKKGEILGMFQINAGDYSPTPQILVSHSSPTVVCANHPMPHTAGGLSGLFSTKPGKYILRIRGGKLSKDILREDRTLFLAFDDFSQLVDWQQAIIRGLELSINKNGVTRNKLLPENENIGNFGEQARCKNKRCQALNNTLYGNACLNCGSFLFDKSSSN